MGTDVTDSDEGTIVPVLDEQASIETRTVVTGRVRVETRTETVEEIARARLDGEELEIERVPIGTAIDHVPAVRTEGDVTIIPIVEEVLIVEKRLVLKEELHVRRTATAETVEVPVTLRKQRAFVEHVDGDGDRTEEDSR